jgi:hypothetical protein
MPIPHRMKHDNLPTHLISQKSKTISTPIIYMKKHLLTILFLYSVATSLQAQQVSKAAITTSDTAYCDIAYDPLSGYLGPAKFALSNPGVLTRLSDQPGEYMLNGGTWFNNQWYGMTMSDNALATINTQTGNVVILGRTGKVISEITYDYSTNTLFAIDYDFLYESSSLYTINITNGTPTLIGQCCTGFLQTLACDSSGNLYSVGTRYDLLYKIDKTTGAATSIGPIGFDANFAQGLEFDMTSGILYMAAYNATAHIGELRTVNLLTGATTLIGKFENGAEIAGFAIPNNKNFLSIEDFPAYATSFQVFPNPSSDIITIKTPEIKNESQLSIFNLSGQKLMHCQVLEPKTIIDISSLLSGIYFVTVMNDKTILTSKFVKL